MWRALKTWIARRRAIRAAWQADARMLLELDERRAWYEGQRRAVQARKAGDRAQSWHWIKAANEAVRLSPRVEMDTQELHRIVDREQLIP